jgi:hypothetical protein
MNRDIMSYSSKQIIFLIFKKTIHEIYEYLITQMKKNDWLNFYFGLKLNFNDDY